MNDIGRLKLANGRYEFSFDELDLVVRGAHAEWVLEAASEIITHTARADLEGQLLEVETLVEMGEADEIELDIAKSDASARFDRLPQCTVTMGAMDYRWMSPDGRAGTDDQDVRQVMERLVDQSKTRSDSFLKNVDGAYDRSPTE